MESARSKWLWIVASLLILVWTAFPVVWIVMLSFKQPSEIG
ncbi:MAG: carbohydrate ABC transporter permease, partial [Streptomycetaceae bacterium]|nr:carbohydrate ABC transporter permease [Streptomycetaceae bacterium]